MGKKKEKAPEKAPDFVNPMMTSSDDEAESEPASPNSDAAAAAAAAPEPAPAAEAVAVAGAGAVVESQTIVDEEGQMEISALRYMAVAAAKVAPARRRAPSRRPPALTA
jgi:hypothetical protein